MKVFCSDCRQLVDQRDYRRHVARHRPPRQPQWKRGRRWMALREQTIAVFGPRCWQCGRQFPENDLEADHVIPRSEGGPDEPYNAQLLCKRCHADKHRG